MQIAGFLWFVFISMSVARADFLVSEWRFWTPLVAPDLHPTAAGFVRVTLPGSVLSQAKVSLEDIRVIDGSGIEVPYILLVERSQAQETTVPASILDRGVVPKQYQQVVCDLGKQKSFSNEIRLETPTRNFRRRVDVLGSPDGQNWLELKIGSHILDQHEGGFQYRNLRVAYPETSYRYLKLILWLDGGTPLELRGVRVVRVIHKEIEPEKIPARIARRQENATRKATDLFLETDLEKQHLEACVVEIAQENFQRRAEVSFQNRDRVWTKVGGADIYRFKIEETIDEQLSIPLSDLNQRQVRLRIWNQDNPPLEVTSVMFKRMPRVVIFRWEVGKSYRLFLGNPRARTPSYDLNPVVRQLDITQLARFNVGTPMPSPDFLAPEETQPWTERHPVLLWSGLALGILLLGWMLLRTLREMKAEM